MVLGFPSLSFVNLRINNTSIVKPIELHSVEESNFKKTSLKRNSHHLEYNSKYYCKNCTIERNPKNIRKYVTLLCQKLYYLAIVLLHVVSGYSLEPNFLKLLSVIFRQGNVLVVSETQCTPQR